MASGQFWIIGCGNMGGAMLRGWISAGLDPKSVTVVDPQLPTLPEGTTVLASLPEQGTPDRVLLSVKPQLLGEVADALAARLGPETVLMSILAGVETGSLRARFSGLNAIIRIMPNTPAAIGKGVIALFSDDANDKTRANTVALMAPLGLVEWIVDEPLFDAVTALSGSGPAFLFRFIDALGQAGAAIGLPADQAARFALATVEGAALLAAQSAESPGILADRVASPGGSTREGMNVLDHDGALVKLLTRTLKAAEMRNSEMAAAARG
jgi:pyrroline-5-carboxylate reductase